MCKSDAKAIKETTHKTDLRKPGCNIVRDNLFFAVEKIVFQIHKKYLFYLNKFLPRLTN